MKRVLLIIISLLVIVSITAAAVWKIRNDRADTEDNIQSNDSVQEDDTEIVIAPEQDINDVHLRDNKYLYEDVDDSVVTMYLTVFYGNKTDNTNHTWDEVNKYSAYYYEEKEIDRYRVAALIQVGDEKGPQKGELGYGLHVPNAYVQIRGQTSSNLPQKNYKIKILDSFGEWRQQTTIAINKHMSEGLRFRNKLSFDIMSEIPQLMSLRTQFVHLYVCDKTGDNPDEFVDYGLYTQVEQPNRTYMKLHGLDRNGYLYKVNYFEFNLLDEIKTVDDPGYDRNAFEKLLETKGREDHEKLLKMLKALNDYSISNEEVIDKYFDSENIAYWMAFMMLIGNSDTQNRNMYLYSPLNGDKWYILPWDMDGSLLEAENHLLGFSDFTDWEKGVSNYWGNTLFKRALMTSRFRKELDDAVEDLYANYLNPAKVKALADKYANVTREYLRRMPDNYYSPLTPDEYEEILDSIPDQITRNYELYKRSLQAPMPGFVNTPEKENGKLVFTWDTFFNFDNSDIKYNFKLSDNYDFDDVIWEEYDLYLTRVETNITLPAGQYFVHVDATNEAGYTTNCFDYYDNEKGKVYGVFSFFVDENGDIYAYEHVSQ